MISASARATGIASGSLFGPKKARTTHSAMKHEMRTDAISQSASVAGLIVLSFCINARKEFHTEGQRKTQSPQRNLLCGFVSSFVPLCELISSQIHSLQT